MNHTCSAQETCRVSKPKTRSQALSLRQANPREACKAHQAFTAAELYSSPHWPTAPLPPFSHGCVLRNVHSHQRPGAASAEDQPQGQKQETGTLLPRPTILSNFITSLSL